MNWLPSLLNPAAAAIAAGVVVPSLLLLYFLKLRRKEHPFASTLLWKKSVQDLQVNAPFQRLRRNLLLFLQLAALLALVLAFARPVSFNKTSTSENTLLLIDHSASMNVKDADGGRTRLEEAKRRAIEQIDSLPKNGRASVIAFDSSAQVVQQLTEDKQSLRNAIEGIAATDQPTRLQMGYQLAEAAVQVNPEQMKDGQAAAPDLYVYSDGRVLDTDKLSFRGRVTYEKIGSDKTGNIGIVALSARRNYERPNEVTVFARLANYGPEPVTADLELSVAELDPANPSQEKFVSRQIRETATLVPDRWDEAKQKELEASGTITRDSVEFKLDLTTAAIIRVEQKSKQNDLFDVDDIAQVIVPPPRRLSVALVTPGDNMYLDAAIPTLGLERPVTLTPAEYEANPPKDHDVIVFDRYSPKVIPEDGSFVYFGGLPPNTALKHQVNEVGVPQVAEDVFVLDWKRDHPILRSLNLSRIFVAQAMRVNVPEDAELLVEGTTTPLMILYRQPRQTHLVFTFDSLESNWPTHQTFQLVLFNIMQFLSLGSEMDVREGYTPGSVPRIPRANLVRADPEAREVKLIGPDRTQTVAVPETGDFVLPPLNRVGLYRMEPSIPQYERLAVNLLDANESNVFPSNIAPGSVGTADSSSESRGRFEWWWWLVACVVLPLLMIEWWIYTRRVQV
jgi:hypothetical protein